MMKNPETAIVTWLGEDDLHDVEGPQTNEWRGITFVKGQPVEIDNPHLIEKAKSNPFYTVET